jgi:hypothetical protein
MRGTEEWQTYLRNNSWDDSFLAGDAFGRFLEDDTRRTATILAGLQLGEAGAGYAAVGPWTFPSMALAGLALSVIAVIRKARIAPPPPRIRQLGLPVMQTAVVLAAYLAAFERIGFVVATLAYLVLQARIFGSRATRRDVIVSLVITVVAYGVFDRLLQVRLPSGDWLASAP